jgi:hypothetical protein
VLPGDVRDALPVEAVIVQAEKLLPVAAAILQNRDHLPPAFLRGEPVSLRVLGDTLGYNHTQIRLGLIQLKRLGMIKTVDFGRAGRKQYAGAARLARARVA